VRTVFKINPPARHSGGRVRKSPSGTGPKPHRLKKRIPYVPY
jgi:hypothetical protein